MISNMFIHYNVSHLHFAITGNGNKHLLVFHGFGQDMRVFEFFTQSLARQYTFYVFDLYFHGKSEWAHNEKTLSKAEWKETITIFLQENNIETFALAGFSMGGKFVLAILEAFPEKVNALYLIAPDGITTSFWYQLATYPIVFRKFFKSMILYPNRFLTLARWLNKLGLIDQGLIRFAEYQMATEEKRSRVYYSWVVFRHLHFDPTHIAYLINTNNIHFTLIAGKHDKVITSKNLKRFLKKIKKYRFEILESGHSRLINQSLPFFTESHES